MFVREVEVKLVVVFVLGSLEDRRLGWGYVSGNREKNKS